MYCSKCGQELNGRFCSNCGYDSKKNIAGNSFLAKVKSFFKGVWDFIVSHKKPVILLSSAFALTLTGVIILVLTLTNIYSLWKVEQISIGMRESAVIDILGEPTVDEDNTLYWYEDKVSNKIRRIDEIMEEALFLDDFESMEKAAQEHDKLVAELEEMTFKFIMVKLDSNDKVSEVFLDMKHKYDDNWMDYSTEEKTVESVTINKSQIDGLQIADDEGNVIDIQIQIPDEERSGQYIVYFKDGSYLRSTTYLNNITPNKSGNEVSLSWSNELSDYKVTVPLRVTARISESGILFEWYSQEATAVIPSNVVEIKDGAFSYCDSLTSITVDENNANYKSIAGNLYSKDGKTLIKYAIGKTETSFKIPGSVTTIDYGAFDSCTSLTSVEIPDRATLPSLHPQNNYSTL